MSDYHLSFTEIEEMPLEILLEMEIVDSKIEAAFAKKNSKQPFSGKKLFLDQIH